MVSVVTKVTKRSAVSSVTKVTDTCARSRSFERDGPIDMSVDLNVQAAASASGCRQLRVRGSGCAAAGRLAVGGVDSRRRALARQLEGALVEQGLAARGVAARASGASARPRCCARVSGGLRDGSGWRVWRSASGVLSDERWRCRSSEASRRARRAARQAWRGARRLDRTPHSCDGGQLAEAGRSGCAMLAGRCWLSDGGWAGRHGGGAWRGATTLQGRTVAAMLRSRVRRLARRQRLDGAAVCER